MIASLFLSQQTKTIGFVYNKSKLAFCLEIKQKVEQCLGKIP